MRIWIAQLAWIVGTVATFAHGADRPPLPGPTVDDVLLQGQTPQAFFSARVRQCNGLEDLRSDFREERQRLDDLLPSAPSSSALKAQKEKVDAAQGAWMTKVKECGPCHMRPIRKVKVTSAGATENWFVSDGSCFLPGLSPAEARRAFAARARSLETVADYKTDTGGFSQVVEFLPVDPANGQPSGVAQISSPYEGFIAVRGPVLFGVRTAAGYYFGGGFRQWTDAQGEQYYSHFSAKRAPRGFRQPRLREKDLTGKTHAVRLIQLSNAQGQWYLTEDGYLRYTTAADFGLSLKFLSDMAETILLETLLDLAERGLSE